MKLEEFLAKQYDLAGILLPQDDGAWRKSLSPMMVSGSEVMDKVRGLSNLRDWATAALEQINAVIEAADKQP